MVYNYTCTVLSLTPHCYAYTASIILTLDTTRHLAKQPLLLIAVSRNEYFVVLFLSVSQKDHFVTNLLCAVQEQFDYRSRKECASVHV